MSFPRQPLEVCSSPPCPQLPAQCPHACALQSPAVLRDARHFHQAPVYLLDVDRPCNHSIPLLFGYDKAWFTAASPHVSLLGLQRAITPTLLHPSKCLSLQGQFSPNSPIKRTNLKPYPVHVQYIRHHQSVTFDSPAHPPVPTDWLLSLY